MLGEAGKDLAGGPGKPRYSRVCGRRRPNALTANPFLEDPRGSLEGTECVHTPPCRPVPAQNLLAAR